MPYFNFNGKIFSENAFITGPDNRGLRYGDGLFETIKYKNGELLLIDEHLARLWKGLQLMQFQPSKLLTPDLLQNETLQLIKKNGHFTARVRISVIRGNGGLYDAKDHSPNYIIQSWVLEHEPAMLNENGLQLCIFKDAKKSIDIFSNLKHNNFLPYFMGALYAKKERCNDAVILNSNGNICDSTIANIFIIKDQQIFTPNLEEGCIAGVMRKQIIQELITLGYEINETPITIDTLLAADEVFLTNSIYNIRWVASIEDKKYANQLIQNIYLRLKQTNAVVFC